MMPVRRFLSGFQPVKTPAATSVPQRDPEEYVLGPKASCFYKAVLTFAVVTLCVTMASAGTTAQKSRHKRSSAKAAKTVSGKETSRHTRHTVRGRNVKRTRAPRGQQVIDSGRATQIQEALIREKYLDGEPSGMWDQRTREAMARYQADNGWQTKSLPDSRALIKLGLGPNRDNVINPETAATTSPVSAVTVPTESAINRQ